MVLEFLKFLRLSAFMLSLNPSLGGIWSWSSDETWEWLNEIIVLILLWVEYGLGDREGNLEAIIGLS